MLEVKRLFDPSMLLNPGVLLSEDHESYTHDLKGRAGGGVGSRHLRRVRMLRTILPEQ